MAAPPAPPAPPAPSGQLPSVTDRIEIWWADDRAYYAGTVVSASVDGTCSVEYDDGEREDLNLRLEAWRRLATPAAPAVSGAPAPAPAPVRKRRAAAAPARKIHDPFDDDPEINPAAAPAPVVAAPAPAAAPGMTLAAGKLPANQRPRVPDASPKRGATAAPVRSPAAIAPTAASTEAATAAAAGPTAAGAPALPTRSPAASPAVVGMPALAAEAQSAAASGAAAVAATADGAPAERTVPAASGAKPTREGLMDVDGNGDSATDTDDDEDEFERAVQKRPGKAAAGRKRTAAIQAAGSAGPPAPGAGGPSKRRRKGRAVSAAGANEAKANGGSEAPGSAAKGGDGAGSAAAAGTSGPQGAALARDVLPLDHVMTAVVQATVMILDQRLRPIADRLDELTDEVRHPRGAGAGAGAAVAGAGADAAAAGAPAAAGSITLHNVAQMITGQHSETVEQIDRLRKEVKKLRAEQRAVVNEIVAVKEAELKNYFDHSLHRAVTDIGRACEAATQSAAMRATGGYTPRPADVGAAGSTPTAFAQRQDAAGPPAGPFAAPRGMYPPPGAGYERVGGEGQSVQGRVVQLVARQATVWLLETQHECPDVAKRDAWATETAARCLAEVAGKLGQFKDYGHAIGMLVASLGDDNAELGWFLRRPLAEDLRLARDNYAAWEPPPSDEEWVVEELLLTELSNRFHDALPQCTAKAAVDDLAASIDVARLAAARPWAGGATAAAAGAGRGRQTASHAGGGGATLDPHQAAATAAAQAPGV
jgi:hypothetical protein